ncbi:hypothetical protein [Phreatobacter sp.]|uniref:hypothetical protein n=1 Tax=Phreatobacter sp. TaxID=1966341 RepID=UPI003F721C2B
MTKPHRAIIPLEGSPNIATYVGFVAGHFALLEDQMCRLYASLLRISRSNAQLTFYEFAARRRREILKALLAEIDDKALADEAISFIDEHVKRVTDRRNEFMHHMWAAGGKGRIVRIDPTRTLSGKQLVYETELSAKAFFEDIAVVNERFQRLLLRITSP